MIHLVHGSLSGYAKLVRSGNAYGNRYFIYFDPYPSERVSEQRAKRYPYSVVSCHKYEATVRHGAGEECEQIDRTLSIEDGVSKAYEYLASMWQIETGIGKWGRPPKRRLGTSYAPLLAPLANPLTHFEMGTLAVGGALVLGGLALAFWPKKAAATPIPQPTQTWVAVPPDADGNYSVTPGLYGFAATGVTPDQVQPTITSPLFAGAQISTSPPPGFPVKGDLYATFSVMAAGRVFTFRQAPLYRVVVTPPMA